LARRAPRATLAARAALRAARAGASPLRVQHRHSRHTGYDGFVRLGMHGMSSESGSRSSFVQNPASLIAEFRTQFELQMDGPAAAPVLEMRLGVDSCTLGPFPVPRLGGAAGGAERIVLLMPAAGCGGGAVAFGCGPRCAARAPLRTMMTTSSERLDHLMKEPCCCRLYHPTFVRHSLLCGSRQQSKAQPPSMAPFMYCLTA
jgi:hypothetical protein